MSLKVQLKLPHPNLHTMIIRVNWGLLNQPLANIVTTTEIIRKYSLMISISNKITTANNKQEEIMHQTTLIPTPLTIIDRIRTSHLSFNMIPMATRTPQLQIIITRKYKLKITVEQVEQIIPILIDQKILTRMLLQPNIMIETLLRREIALI